MTDFSDMANEVTPKTRLFKFTVLAVFFMSLMLTSYAALDNKTTDLSAIHKAEAEKIIRQQKNSIDAAKSEHVNFFRVGGFPGFVIWVLLSGSTLLSIYVIFDVYSHVRRNRRIPKNLITEVREYLRQGELGYAVDSCKESHTPLGRIVAQAFKNIEDGFDAAKDSMELMIKIERENLCAPARRLLFCGIASLGLGFCGFCISLANALTTYAVVISVGNARMLAMSCGQSLYPLIVGSTTAFICFLMWVHADRKNRKIMVNTEKLAHEMVKVLRGAEIIEDEDFSEKSTMTQLFTAPAMR